MAVIATATIVSLYPDDPVNGSATFTVDVDVFIAGTNFGGLTPGFQTSIPGLSPTSLSIKNDITSALKTVMTNNGVTFGLLDTISLI